jgi:hypothetical protein
VIFIPTPRYYYTVRWRGRHDNLWITPNTGEWSLSEFCKTPTRDNIAGVEVIIRSNNVEHVIRDRA